MKLSQKTALKVLKNLYKKEYEDFKKRNNGRKWVCEQRLDLGLTNKICMNCELLISPKGEICFESLLDGNFKNYIVTKLG